MGVPPGQNVQIVIVRMVDAVIIVRMTVAMIAAFAFERSGMIQTATR